MIIYVHLNPNHPFTYYDGKLQRSLTVLKSRYIRRQNLIEHQVEVVMSGYDRVLAIL